MALRQSGQRLSAQKLLVTQRIREREGKEFIPGRIIWDECTFSGPANHKIQPPMPMKGPLGWKLWFYERGLEGNAKDFETGVFSLKVLSALQEEFAKIEAHAPPQESHHRPGGKILIPHQHVESERKPQTCSSIPKDAYELQKFIDEKNAFHKSELFSIQKNHDWQWQQSRMYKNPYAGAVCEDSRFIDECLDEDDHGKLLGGQIAQSFILAWLIMLAATLIWRVK
eukprot:TRINITY_DN24552_c0_g1_i1.p1 TRINITY_DN24552_c0_g1~~TRINITY_DN24552_c0_g1_i1.p1  ORF type:complete len:226 (+),score=108.54 TRINITY_DN24552_c0_g1_i1:61-738(+)